MHGARYNMATITTDTFLDEGGARTAGEAWTMNGAILTIRTDTRWHENAPASMTGSIGATTISATLGGGVLIDATAVREVQFDSGSGNVPAIGTVITQGGASGYLLGVWADLNSAPTVVGNLMPTTGFIKFREVTGSFSAGVLTGIGASALGADTVSWIEVVQRQAVANTVPRLGFWRTRGNWYTLPQTTNGIAGQIIQIPTNGGGVGTHVPAIWIETGIGTNEYEAFPAIRDTWFISTNLGTDARAKFVETMGSGQVRIGNNGTENVGFLPPDGCRIRIPNILGRQSTLVGGDANNQTPHTTVASRPDWTTTAAGDIDFEYFMDDWYHLFSAPYKVKHINCATFDIHSTINEAAPTNLNNYVTGSYNGTSIPLVLSTNPLGGIIQNCKFIRAAAGSNSHAISLNLCTDYTFTNCHVGVITFARGSGRSVAVAQSLNIAFNDIYQYNAYMQFTTSFNITVNNLDHCDRFVGDTNTTSGIYCVSVLTSSDNIKVDGLTFGLKGTLSGYHNPYLAPFYTINSSNVTFRNAGTRAVPLLVNPAAQSIYAAHDAGANTNVRFQRIYLDNTRTSVYLTLNTSKNVTFESVHGTTGAVQTLALNVLSKGIRATTNSVTAGASVYGSHYFDMFISDIRGIVWFAMNEPTIFSEDYVTLTLTGATGGFTSGGQISLPNVGDQLVMEMPYFAIGHTGFDNSISPIATGVNPENFSYEYDIDTGNGFSGNYKNLMKTKVRASGGTSGTNTITLTAKDSPMPEVGDFLLSPAGTQYSPGTTVTDVTGNVVTVSDNFLINLTGTVYFIKDITNEVINQSVGFKLKLKITTTDSLNTNALTYVSVGTLSTLNAQINNLYPLDYSTITISGFVANSRVRIYDTTNSVELFNDIVSGTSISYSAPYSGNYMANIRVMYSSPTTAYLLEEFDDLVTVNGLSRNIVQILDAVYNTNAIDGEIITGVTIDYSTDRIMLEESTTWANIYARRTFRLYQENGISEKSSVSFLLAIDTANYKLSGLKLLNVSNPSVPIGITGGWAIDFTTNKSVDTVDNTGGTIFSMPEHVIPYETSGGAGGGLTTEEHEQLMKLKNPSILIDGEIIV